MRISTFKQKKSFSRYPVISTFFILLIFFSSLPAFAQDTSSIDTLRQMGKAFASIAEKASPAVVGLKAEKTITRQYSLREWPFGDSFDPFQDDLFDYFFRRAPRERPPRREYRIPQTAQGSGFIISADGYILTNNHMVEGAEKLEIELADGRKFTAEIKGTDPESDVAVIKIDANDLPFLELADSDALEVGEWVLAIGNPFGYSHTVTAGIVSAKGRSDPGLGITYQDFIQTDAAINPGNSGGPLLNLNGKVIGINTAIVGLTGGNIGIGFAIPINMAKAVYPQLMKGETVERGFLGLLPQNLTLSMAEQLGLKDAKGVIISEITEGSPADKAGLKHNDVILEFNGKPVESENEFRRNVALLKPGTNVEIVVWRDGKRKTLTATLEKRPPLNELLGARPGRLEELGFAVQNLTDEFAERYGYQGQSGVIVTEVEPGSRAAQEGIKAGMLIKEVNFKPVKNTREFNEAIEQARKKESITFLVNDGRNTRYLELKLPKD